MHRASFLARTAGGLAAIALAPLDARAAGGETLEYRLTSVPTRFAPVPGVVVDGLSYNGRIPGPVLRARRGQCVRVRYTNAMHQPGSIHWHGFILPNAMDGAAGVTQRPVEPHGSFTYEFEAQPAGTRWYHDHVMMARGSASLASMRGLFGLFVIEDPSDEPADAEFAIVLHDVPDTRSALAAMRGVSDAPMVDPAGSEELRAMGPHDRMGDEVAYRAHLINGAAYPSTAPLIVKLGARVRLRILNANPTQTRYLRLADHRLRVTHADGNRLDRAADVDILRIGVAERYDVWFEVRKPGAWLLQMISSDPLAYQQAVVVATPGRQHEAPRSALQTLEGLRISTYANIAGTSAGVPARSALPVRYDYALGGGVYASDRWTMNGKRWPNTEKIHVRHGEQVQILFTNRTEMHHPMHLHGHVLDLVEADGVLLERPLRKDVTLVSPHGGTVTWNFTADSPPGRWLLHCHNEVHMMDGMMTEVVYRR